MESKQLRILIVEDEIAVRRSLKGKIRRYEQCNFEIEEAKNAEAAYEQLKKDIPDLIFLDMKMPGMGGMAFLEILRVEYPKVKVIVLSGYSDFQYVQKALQCGAMDYLLKPVIKEDLYKAISEVKRRIDQERMKVKSDVEDHQLLKRSTALLKDNLMNDLLYSDQKQATDLLKKLKMLGIEFNYDRYLIMNLYILNVDDMKSYFSSEGSLLYFGLENLIKESLVHSTQIVSFPSKVNHNELISIIGINEQNASREKNEQDSYTVIKNIRIYQNIKLQLINSELFSNLTELYSSYEKVSSVFQESKKDSELLFVDDIFRSKDQSLLGDVWSVEEEKHLEHLLELGDAKMSAEFVQNHFSKLYHGAGETTVGSIALSSAMFKVFENYCQTQPLGESSLTLSEFLLKYKDDLRVGLISVFSQVSGNPETGQSKKESKQILQEIQEYLQTNYYDNEISLDGLAKRYFINRSYLSEVFKTEFGVPFKKYLVQLRLEKAKDLLSEQRLKVSDVAYLVGFNDPDYFGSVFKKQVGMTASVFSDKFTV
ncbi:response regulator transcription factor [Aquibacillus saliphilus]|uniref:response regulator transcription factor n=1 Tax=Aquibacillus saliphilus TaxID=1909422 RepID=UPI001CF00270|nr:response regulator [Aquibacillus saliphilus]